MRIILSVNYISRLNTGISNVLKIMLNSYTSLNHKVYIAAMNDEFTEIDKNDFISNYNEVKSKIIIIDDVQQTAPQVVSGGESQPPPTIVVQDSLNSFIKQKLFLDLAYT